MDIVNTILNFNIEDTSDEEEIDENYIGYENFVENVFTSTGQTPLTASCIDGNRVMVQFLLRNGADPNMKDDTGMTPLHAACLSMNSITVTEKLLLRGANVNTKAGTENIQGETPLHYVIKDLSQKGQKRRLLYAQTLLKYGANPSIRSRVIDPIIGRKTINAREYASLKGRKRLARILRSSRLYRNRKRKAKNESLQNVILNAIVDFPPMLYAIFFTLMSGYITSGSHPAIAGLSLGLAVFLTLLYVIIGYQNKRYTRMMRNGTTADDDDERPNIMKSMTLHSSSNRKKKKTNALVNLNRSKAKDNKYQNNIINYERVEGTSRTQKKKLASKKKRIEETKIKKRKKKKAKLKSEKKKKKSSTKKTKAE